uniref:Tachylectin 2 domain-containing protein n=1 Tax=Leptobrachium leishanense TaxID=445787 RepID=A0A8C5QL90_9ANUR
MEVTQDAVLFVVTKDFLGKVGPPPKDRLDNFNARTPVVGKLNNVSKIAFNPDGELFAVRDDDLYRGPMPSDANLDWFTVARRVGKGGWNRYKFMVFDPCGVLYAATHDGQFFKGPAPTDDTVCWLSCCAIKVGTGAWNDFDSLFFDSQAILYAVSHDDRLLKRYPPTRADDDWYASSTTIGKAGWRSLSHFMGFSPDGDLWCVDSSNGNIYKGPAPDTADTNYIEKAENLGHSYNMYPFLAFTSDKPNDKSLVI